MLTIEAVIFDLDDTLLDHRAAATAGVSEWLTALGVPPTPELVDIWFTVEKKYFDLSATGAMSVSEHRRRRVAAMLAAIDRPAPADEELDGMFLDYLSCYERHWRPFDDAPAAVSATADAGVTTALLTNGFADQQHRKLIAIGLPQLTDRLFAATATGLWKPNPRAYLNVCEAIGSRPANTLHVGDRYDLDYEAPRAAGLQAVIVDREQPSNPPARIRSLAEIAQLL